MFEQTEDKWKSHDEVAEQGITKEGMVIHHQEVEPEEEWKILNDQHFSQFRKMLSLKPDKIGKRVSLGGFEWIGDQSGKVADKGQQEKDMKQDKQNNNQKAKKETNNEQLISRREERLNGEAQIFALIESIVILCGGMEYIERTLKDSFIDSQDKLLLGVSVIYAFAALCYITCLICRASRGLKNSNRRGSNNQPNNQTTPNPSNNNHKLPFLTENFSSSWKNRYCLFFLIYLLILDFLRIEVFLNNADDRLFLLMLSFFVNQIALRRLHFQAGRIFSFIIVIYFQGRYAYQEHKHLYIIGSCAALTLACCLHYFVLSKKQKQTKMLTEKAEYVSEYFKQFYHNIVSMMPQGILIIDESEKLVYANRTTKKILQCGSKSAIIDSLSRLIVGKEQPEQNFFEDTKTIKTLRTIKSVRSAKSGRSGRMRKNNNNNNNNPASSNPISSFHDTESFMSTYQNPDTLLLPSAGSSSNVPIKPLQNIPVIRPLRMISGHKSPQNIQNLPPLQADKNILYFQQPQQSPSMTQYHLQTSQVAFPNNLIQPAQQQQQYQSVKNSALNIHYQPQDLLSPIEYRQQQPLQTQFVQQSQQQNTPPQSQIESPSRQNIEMSARQFQQQSDKKAKSKTKNMPFKYLNYQQQSQSNFENMSIMEIISVLLKECSLSIRGQQESNDQKDHNNYLDHSNKADKLSEVSMHQKKEDNNNNKDSKIFLEEQPDSLSSPGIQMHPQSLPTNPLISQQQVNKASAKALREKNFSQYSNNQQRDLLGNISHARMNSIANSNSINNINYNNTSSNIQNYFKSQSMQNNFTSSGAYQNISSQMRANSNRVKHQSEIAENSLSVRVKLHDKLFEITFVQCEMSTMQMESSYDEQTSAINNSGKQVSKNSSNFHRILSPPDKTSKTKSAVQIKLQQSDLSNTLQGQKEGLEINLQNLVQTPARIIEIPHGQQQQQQPHSQVQNKRTQPYRTAMVLVFIEDITQEVYMKRLEELNNYKMKMLSSISHELKTPLNCSMGMLEELQSFIASEQFGQENSAEIIRNLIEPAQESNVILLSMIQDLLDMGTIEMGKLHYNFTRFNLRDLLRDRCSVMRRQCLVKKIEIQLVYDTNLDEMIISDENRVGQILINFLSNSLKFTGKNGRIIVRVEPYGVNHFKISIEDNGIGISKQKIANIFKIFGREDVVHNKRQATQGIGIGLSVSNCLMYGLTLEEFQDKPITVKSEEKKGSIFQFILKNQEPHLINVTQTQRDSDLEEDEEEDDTQKVMDEEFQEVIVTISQGVSYRDCESKFNENNRTKSKIDPDASSIADGGGLGILDKVKKEYNDEDDEKIEAVLQEEEYRSRKQRNRRDSFKQKTPIGRNKINPIAGSETAGNSTRNYRFEEQNSENIYEETEKQTDLFKKTQLTPMDSQQQLFDKYFNNLDLEDASGTMLQLNSQHNHNISTLCDNLPSNSGNQLERQGFLHQRMPSIDSNSSKHFSTSYSNSFLPLNLLGNTQAFSSRRRESSPVKFSSMANINGGNIEDNNNNNNNNNSMLFRINTQPLQIDNLEKNYNNSRHLFHTLNNNLSENNSAVQSHNLSIEPRLVRVSSTTSFMNMDLMNQIEDFIQANQLRKNEIFKEEFGQILIVDDVQFNLITLQSLLKKYALKIDLADDGDDAVNKVKEKYKKTKQLYKIIFMDIQMPIKDGFQATKEIRSFLNENNLNQIPIIATSAFGDQQYKDQAKKVGMTDYIEKPIKIQKIDKAFGKYVIK